MKKLLITLLFSLFAAATFAQTCPPGQQNQLNKWRFLFKQCYDSSGVYKYVDTSKIAYFDSRRELHTITYAALKDSLDIEGTDSAIYATIRYVDSVTARTLIPVRDTAAEVVYVFLQMGQSNASGRGEVRRLQNDSFNYWGIKDYPQTRTAQPQYDSIPTGVRIYYKGSNQNANQSPDNGVWQNYVAGTNSQADNTLNQFGAELSLSQRIYAATGSTVYIVKPAWGGTSLNDTIPTSLPGDWLTINDTIAIQYYLVRAMRDLRIEKPYATIKFLGCIWNQGENDASSGIGKEQYKSEFLQFKHYMDSAIVANEPTFTDYQWMLTELNYSHSAAEDSINSALQEVAASLPNVEYITTLEYPRKTDLTTNEASPLAKGMPNAEGGNDDIHLSYIGQLALGEKYYDFFVQDTVTTEYFVQDQVVINIQDTALYFYDTACSCWHMVGAEGSTLTFGTGLTNTLNNVTSNISTGVSGGQTIYGGTASGNSLTIQSTTNATKGFIGFGTTSAFNQSTGHWGFGVTVPLNLIHVEESTSGNSLYIANFSLFTRTNNVGASGNAVYFRFNQGILAGTGAHTNAAAGVDYLEVRTSSAGSQIRAHNGRMQFTGSGNGSGAVYGLTMSNTSSTTVLAFYGISMGANSNLSTFANTGTITNTYGIYLGDMSTGTQTNIWGLYQDDVNARNYFAGASIVGTSSTAIPSAALAVVTTTQGFLPPVMTATQASAISSPATGLLLYVTNTNGTFTSTGWWGYNGATWEKLNN